MTITQERLVNEVDRFGWFVPELRPLTRAIYMTLAYADIFQFPLHISEIHRRLIGVQISLSKLRSYLQEGNINPLTLVQKDGIYALAGSEEIITIRKTREELARPLWPLAIKFGNLIARLPFVKMVSVTGALAVNNVEAGTDLDFLIVTEPGHLWTCRAWAIALVRLAALQGVVLCPNYFISENALTFKEQNLYTAHEMIQMVPIYGLQIYQAIRKDNSWSCQFLPNAVGPPDTFNPNGKEQKVPKRHFEIPFRTSFGTHFERWEMDRKIHKFSRMNGNNTESTFSADWCKGHFDQHGKYTLAALEARLRSLEGAL